MELIKLKTAFIVCIVLAGVFFLSTLVSIGSGDDDDMIGTGTILCGFSLFMANVIASLIIF